MKTNMIIDAIKEGFSRFEKAPGKVVHNSYTQEETAAKCAAEGFPIEILGPFNNSPQPALNT